MFLAAIQQFIGNPAALESLPCPLYHFIKVIYVALQLSHRICCFVIIPEAEAGAAVGAVGVGECGAFAEDEIARNA